MVVLTVTYRRPSFKFTVSQKSKNLFLSFQRDRQILFYCHVFEFCCCCCTVKKITVKIVVKYVKSCCINCCEKYFKNCSETLVHRLWICVSWPNLKKFIFVEMQIIYFLFLIFNCKNDLRRS